MATAQPCFSYGVFLSFRGEDTREGFTGYLYKALKQAGIRTFLDGDGMERGKLMKPELNKAIHESAISVVVFSKNYAFSKWCLDEVLMIIKEHETLSSKHQVIPVFYKVDPSDVRNQRGSFKDAFDAYDDEIKAETDIEKKRQLSEKVGEWMNSLRKAATFSGLVYTDGYEFEFIINIVNVIRKKLDYKALYIEEKLVSIEDRVHKIEKWLQDTSPAAVVLLIVGIGGIGKTTIAMCIYNSFSCNYDGSCFLADINKETSSQHNTLCRFQSQLLTKILNSDKEETIWNIREGICKVTDAIGSKKVLIILDDVTTSEQLDALLGPQRFCPGTKVIITTRQKVLSNAFTIRPKVCYIRPLSTGNATKLFSLYAFHQHQPIEPYLDQSQLVVHRCKGVPLALKVLGSSLHNMPNYVWAYTIRRLEAILDPQIQDILEISYETLKYDTDTDMELFLDIACFFEGEKKDDIVKILTGCNRLPVAGIDGLMDRRLLYLEDGRVMMHILVLKMGQDVARRESSEPGKRTRLWEYLDCFNVLQNQSGTKKVQGFMMDMKKTPSVTMNDPRKELLGKIMHRNNANFKIGALEKMKNLKLLQLNHVTFSGDYKRLPRKLRLLRWHGYPLEAIPIECCLEKLVVLDMSYSKLKRVWDDFKYIGSLKTLNLSYSIVLIKTPDFAGLPALESLILKGCSSLIKVDESIAYLKELVLLDLTDCTNLREFPRLLTSRVLLEMSGCTILGQIQSLDSASSFCCLVDMDLSFCNLFDNSFPNDWSSLVSLNQLNISGNNVTFLPECIQTLPRILIINCAECSNIKSVLPLPESNTSLYAMGNESLEKVQVSQNGQVVVYHENCLQLSEIEGCDKVQSIDKSERKIISYRGLEINTGEGMELGLKVLLISPEL